MEQPGVMIYFDIEPCLNRLTLEEQGMLLGAILRYGHYREEPSFEGLLGMAWDFIRQRIDLDAQRYRAIVERRREAGRRGGEANALRWKQAITEQNEEKQIKPTTTPTTTTNTTADTITNTITNTDTDTDTNTDQMADKPLCVSFSPPEVKDVSDFCQKMGYQIDPESFVDYYTANGWMMGKNHIKDWRAVAKIWSRKSEQSSKADQSSRDTDAIPLWTIGTVL